jgi:hypothetical protein
MPQDARQAHSDSTPVFLAWGMPAETGEASFDGFALWLSGGASLLLWTALAFVLTA